MFEFLSKKKVIELEQKIKLCDSFIDKEIDVNFYTKEKEQYIQEIKRLQHKKKLFLGVGAALALVALFGMLFLLIYYILRQLI